MREERFDSHVPGEYILDKKGKVLKNEGFYGWYKPLRDKYSEMAKERMKRKLDQHPDFGKDKDVKF